MTCDLYQLVSPEEVDTFIDHFPTCAIYKTEDSPPEDLPLMRVGWIRSDEHRPASNRVAEVTGIKHKTPQLILFSNGKSREESVS